MSRSSSYTTSSSGQPGGGVSGAVAASRGGGGASSHLSHTLQRPSGTGGSGSRVLDGGGNRSSFHQQNSMLTLPRSHSSSHRQLLGYGGSAEHPGGVGMSGGGLSSALSSTQHSPLEDGGMASSNSRRRKFQVINWLIIIRIFILIKTFITFFIFLYKKIEWYLTPSFSMTRLVQR